MGVCTIHVGGTTEMEMKERKDRIDDAICATKAAIEEGVVVGGGLSFLKVFNSECAPMQGDYKAGFDCVFNALPIIVLQIAENAGYDSTKILHSTNCWDNTGLNVKDGTMVDYLASGIINPVKVDRLAFENAVSVAMLYASTDCAIVPLPIDRLA